VMAAGRGIKRGLAVVTGLAVLRRKRDE
jgi:hypothetical protein